MVALTTTVTVTVNDQLWRAVSTFRNAGPRDAAYILNRETGRITFGDGVHGARPPIGATVTVSYRHGAGSAGNLSKRIDDKDDVKKFSIVVRENRQVLCWGRRVR